MSDPDKNLGGYWTGAYSYPHTHPSVPFNAHLVETGGSLSGTITEPDPIGFFGQVIVLSDLHGFVTDDLVQFVKQMQNVHQRHTIRYVGQLNAERTRLAGHWTVPGSWSGRFEMTRGDMGEEEAVERREEIDAEA